MVTRQDSNKKTNQSKNISHTGKKHAQSIEKKGLKKAHGGSRGSHCDRECNPRLCQ